MKKWLVRKALFGRAKLALAADSEQPEWFNPEFGALKMMVERLNSQAAEVAVLRAQVLAGRPEFQQQVLDMRPARILRYRRDCTVAPPGLSIGAKGEELVRTFIGGKKAVILD